MEERWRGFGRSGATPLKEMCSIKGCTTPAKHVAKTVNEGPNAQYAEDVEIDDVYDLLRAGVVVRLCNKDHAIIVQKVA